MKKNSTDFRLSIFNYYSARGVSCQVKETAFKEFNKDNAFKFKWKSHEQNRGIMIHFLPDKLATVAKVIDFEILHILCLKSCSAEFEISRLLPYGMVSSFNFEFYQGLRYRLFTLYVCFKQFWNIFNKSLGFFPLNSSLYICYLCQNVHLRDTLDVVKHQKTQSKWC